MKTYIALLRGINVGGNNIIKMADLKISFEKMGFANVRTYIQSGNVIFETSDKRSGLVKKIQETLSSTFDYTSTLVLISGEELKKVVDNAPKSFGANSDKYRYDIMFLMPPLSAKDVIKDVEVRDGVDEAVAGEGVIYFSRLIAKVTKSYMPKVIKLPAYKKMTIRNWKTTTKILSLLNASS